MSCLRMSIFTAAFVAMASMTSAASVTVAVQGFGSVKNGDVNLAGARAAQGAFHAGGATRVEDFESFKIASPSFTAPVIETNVGDFTSLTPTGTGSTNLAPNNQLHVRDGSGNTGSRFNTTLGGANYLDSNDNSGMLWTIPGAAGLGAFDKLSFLATDIDDVGSATFNIGASGDVFASSFILANTLGGKRPNGELLLFTFLFNHAVSDVAIAMNIDRGDGFSIDDVTMSPIPLPAAAWMLIAGVGALVGLGRARKTG